MLTSIVQEQGYWIARSPGMYNIVYVEGIDSTGEINDNKIDEWNDRRIIIQIEEGGSPRIILNSQATTQPGLKFTQNSMDSNGAANIAFGQYKAWRMGMHKGVQPALLQRGYIRLYRDRNKNGIRDNDDLIDIGGSFGLNQHGSPYANPSKIGGHSAGSLVGKHYNLHLEFLDILKSDARYKLNSAYTFITTIIDGKKLIRRETTADRDRDGIEDSLDSCPDEFGRMATKGCPDDDDDGTANKDDNCPKEFGTKENKGCPEVQDTTINEVVVKGTVRLFNSGKKPLPGVQIRSFDAVATISDAEGKFTLVFGRSMKPGKSIFLIANTAGYELVNEEELLPLKVGNTPNLSVDIFMAPLNNTFGALKMQYYQTQLSGQLKNFKDRLRLTPIQRIMITQIAYLDQKQTLEDQIELSLSVLANLSKNNPDPESKVYNNALKLFKEGKIDEVIKILEGNQ